MFFYSLTNDAAGKRTAERLLKLRRQLASEGPPRKGLDTLLLATWNIREFDSPAYGQRLPESLFYIAEIISHFDLVAIQEVRDDLSALEKIKQMLGTTWHYIATDVTEGKAGLVKAFQDATSAVDSTGLCVFTTFAWTLDDIAPQVDAACEGSWTSEKLLEVGERIWNMERLFNNRAGFTAADDKLPERLVKDAAKTGPAKGLVNGLDKMLPEYYSLRGWTAEGVPTNETLDRLAV